MDSPLGAQRRITKSTSSPVEISDLIPQIVVEEIARDRVTMTSHPVEFGAKVTDHAYVEPAEVMLKYGWSNSSEEAGGDEGFVVDAYEQLLELMRARQPVAVYTGKRFYPAMLIVSVEAPTNLDREFSLVTSARCQELIIANTQLTTLPPTDNQAVPRKTAETTSTGSTTVRPTQAAPGGAGRDPVRGGIDPASIPVPSRAPATPAAEPIVDYSSFPGW
jgi:hypothetical protein